MMWNIFFLISIPEDLNLDIPNTHIP